MNYLKEVNYSIGFANSHYIYFVHEENLILYLSLWNDEIAKIIFFDVIGFIYNSGSVISNLYETTIHEFLTETINQCYTGTTPITHKLYLLIDIDDLPVFQIVANKLLITRINKLPKIFNDE